MKIERKEMKTIIKFLKEVQYKPVGGNSRIVFPIELSATKDLDGIAFTLVNNQFGSEKMPEPVLELREDRKTYISYCDLTYARKFDIVSYCELIGCRLSKKAIEEFNSLDCYLVADSNILIKFDIE